MLNWFRHLAEGGTGGPRPDVPPEVKPPEQATRPGMSRRELLGGAATVAAIFGLPLGIKKVFATPELPARETEPRSWRESVTLLHEKIRQEYGKAEERTLDEGDTLYAEQHETLKKLVAEFEAEPQTADGRGILRNLLIECGALGLYAAAETAKKYYNYTEYKREGGVDWFAIRAADHLPTGAQITDDEIDPRLGQTGWEYKDDPNKIEKNIYFNPGWTDEDLQKEFRAVLDNAVVRELVTTSNCTLAEVYSIIKAAIKDKWRHDNSEEDDMDHPVKRIEMGDDEEVMIEDCVKKMLVEREVFLKKIIIGPEVKHYVFFYHPTDQFKGVQNIMGLARDVAPAAKIESVRGVEHNEPGVIEQAKNKLREALKAGAGESTLLFVDTHGHKDGRNLEFGVDKDKSILINNEELAAMILDWGEGASVGQPMEMGPMVDLSDLTIVLGSCYSYDFTGNLDEAIQDLATKRKIALVGRPTIVTGANEGSLAFGAALTDQLEKLAPAFRRQKCVTGADLVRRVQPHGYDYSDLTFFTGATQGEDNLKEIGENEPVASGMAV